MVFSVENLFYSYGNHAALRGISFSADQGQIVGLIGENGAGKSTLIKTIFRMLKPDSGVITLDGKSIASYKAENYPVSYIPDTPVFYEELSLAEHLHFTKAIYPDGDYSVQEILEKFDLSAHQNKIPSALSKGTRQKLMIAMALLREYQLLIADEPFSGLDPKQISVLKELLSDQARKGKTILLSSHLLDVVENICDRYVVIRQGVCLAVGSKAELAHATGLSESNSMEEVYLRLVEKYEPTSSPDASQE